MRKRLFRIGLYVAVLTICVVVIAPFAWLVISSISTRAQLTAVPLKWFPAKPNVEHYLRVFIGGPGSTSIHRSLRRGCCEQYHHRGNFNFHFACGRFFCRLRFYSVKFQTERAAAGHFVGYTTASHRLNYYSLIYYHADFWPFGYKMGVDFGEYNDHFAFNHLDFKKLF